MYHTLEVIFRRPIQLLTLLVLPLLVSLVIAFLLPRSYQSIARLWALRPYGSLGDTASTTNLTATPAHTQATALSELLQTRAFALAVAHETSLASTLTPNANTSGNPQTLDDALFNEISHAVQVTELGDDLFAISYENPNPKVAQQVVAAVVHNYILQAQKIALDGNQQLLNEYQAQLAKAKQVLAMAQTAESQYLSTHSETQSQLLADSQYALLHAQTVQAQTNVQNIQTAIDTAYQDMAQQGTGTNSLFRVQDAPVVPTQPASRLKLFLTTGGVGLALALLICGLYVFILVRRDRAVYSPLDLERVTTLPVVTQIPHLAPTTVSAIFNGTEQ
jgi:uncharacterized protein involved in exopolysaccharide biosynthesis